jgi:hypothetical protein
MSISTQSKLCQCVSYKMTKSQSDDFSLQAENVHVNNAEEDLHRNVVHPREVKHNKIDLSPVDLHWADVIVASIIAVVGSLIILPIAFVIKGIELISGKD